MSRPYRHLITFATILSAAGSLHAHNCHNTGGSFPNPPAAFTHTVIANGNWHQTSVWDTGSVPGAGAIICIPPGKSVTYRTDESNPANVIRFIQAEGELRIGIQNSAKLYVDTIMVHASGSFMVGAPTNPVWSGQKVEVVFKPWNGLAPNPGWDPKSESLGLVSMGQVKLYGESKSHMVTMTRDALKTQSALLLDGSPVNWQTGDRLVLPGSYFRQTTASTSSQDEVLTVTAVTGSSVQFSPPLAHVHIRPGNFRLHVANLSRNLVLRSEPPALPNPERYRGHIMLMSANVELKNVALVDLGRTDKRIPLDDFEVTLYDDPPVSTPPAYNDYSIVARPDPAVNNRRGRYALHFHKIGISPGQPAPSKVSGSVVEGTVGWGFVNHSSHVDFTGNIAYNFVGAGFVTEFGDELGTFENNIAIRGIGDGIYDPVRIVFDNPSRPQPLADFAFRGDGFWFQGPAVRAINNVAAGCDGAGMIWHATGSPNVESTYVTPNGRTHNRYSFFPGSALSLVYAGFSGLQPRYWNFGAANEKLVIADLPLLQNTGFEAYGNFVGHRLRFNNHDSLAWYGESPYRFDLDINSPYANGRVEQKLEDQMLWNNQYAFNLRYVSETHWKNTSAINRLDHTVVAGSPPQYPYGAEFFLAVEDIRFENLRIDGYESAGILDRGAPNTARSEISFIGFQDYQNYATIDSRFPAHCPTPVFQSYANVGPETRDVVVQTHTAHGRYLARYRAVGDQQWRMTSAPAALGSTAIPLNKLQSGLSYQVQVAAGCKDVTDYDQDGISTEESAPSLYFATQSFAN